MQLLDVLFILIIVLAVVLGLLYYFNRKNMKKVTQAQDFIEQNKISTQIFVIDKKMEKPTPSNVTKAVYDQLPKTAKIRKMPLVKAKVGPQIVNLMCDKSVFEIMPMKKNVKVELAGIYIVKIQGTNLANKKKKTFGEKMSLKMKQMQQKSK
ncbi:MAG TPA: hypothetical protein IAB62_07010 [Candidatus Coprocola pullicola]|nr:hypothetical protein [Candidatus Coprocola pullicola]